MPTPHPLVRIFLGVLLLAVAVGAAERQPNIIVILADDLGYGTLGVYGHPTFKTPNIDRMAAEGVRLTHFNAPTASCAPTRASLMTGRYPFRCGLTANPSPAGPALRCPPSSSARSRMPSSPRPPDSPALSPRPSSRTDTT